MAKRRTTLCGASKRSSTLMQLLKLRLLAALVRRACLLIYQLWTLKHCFAIYIDVVTGQPLHALREHRGRDRRLPFLYNPDTHSLDQRA
mmetsp:Transcript_12916/g.45366  ORF Transcript_12916/g.45366 Transcript_12916/m.45366 type:complete len:89 (+) Transcript_12916:541-807(+)